MVLTDSIRVVAVMENNKRTAIADNGVIWMRPLWQG